MLSRRRRGMTLIEIVVALVVGMPIFFAVTQSLTLVFEVAARQTIRQIRLGQFNQCHFFLDRDLDMSDTVWIFNPAGGEDSLRLKSDSATVRWQFDGVTLRRTEYDTLGAVTGGPSQFLSDVEVQFESIGIYGDEALRISIIEVAADCFSMKHTYTGDFGRSEPMIMIGP